MSGPWEAYQSNSPAEAGPWAKYGGKSESSVQGLAPGEQPPGIQAPNPNMQEAATPSSLVSSFTKHSGNNLASGLNPIQALSGAYEAGKHLVTHPLTVPDAYNPGKQFDQAEQWMGDQNKHIEQVGMPNAVAESLGDTAGTAAASAAAPMLLKGAGRLIAAPAPAIAETALGVRNVDRAFHRAPGEAILNETEGVRPETIANSAQSKVKDLAGQRDALVDSSPNMGTLQPTRDLVKGRMDQAKSRNAAETVNQLQPLQDHVATNAFTGQNLSPIQTPRGILNLRHGVNDDFVTNWKPERQQGVNATSRDVYRSLGDQVHNTVPGTEELDSRMSNLIPVRNRAEATDLNANTLQRSLGRFARPTGALAGGLMGAVEGGQHGGIPGAVAGLVTGVGLPELMASPTAQMTAARTLHGTGKFLQAPATMGTAAALPLLKPRNTEQ